MTRTEIEQSVLNAFKKEFPNIPEIQLEDNFKDLNFDSLLRVRLLFMLEETFNADFSALNLHECNSLAEVIDRVLTQIGKAEG